ncbi:fumarylacetoacetate hydrolase family protein [Brevundimonas goettingensis]|uniref:Fumarylacetoacetate hydrolase family protein n=1 Tax=Brevundimonas goettingensis TaxID=2774190 RepID=A0A975C133_9CAUL|nr:fumarylacetoacetate hydrolase family protein [Brevundimonas goettingensis]QTC91938.1 fumarylacetoacetate hydrolase family protein [Brevundimonas goettingensis]
MRFISYSSAAGEGVGLWTDGGYRGLSTADLGGELKAFLGDTKALAGLALRLAQAPLVDLETVDLLPPVPRPNKTICIGLNYLDHSAESGFEAPTYPTVFARFANSLIGHGAPLVRPDASDMFDYEAELVAVIGKGGRHISKAEALDHVVGYTLCNDASVRDYQIKSPQWTMGKVWDGTGAVGPALVTADELPEGCKGMTLTMKVNGELLQSASIDDMIFDIATLVSVLSEAMTLEPGDIIISGTPGGVGASRKPYLWLKPGDEAVVEIEGLGTLVNRVVQEIRA